MTAYAPGDFTATSGTLLFAVGESAKTIFVPVVADPLAENDETFEVRLSAPTGATIQDPAGLGSILNDDFAPIPSFSASVGLGGEMLLDASASVPGSSAIDRYEWHFSDNTSLTPSVPTTTHIFGTHGTFATLDPIHISLTLVDRYGNRSTSLLKEFNLCAPDVGANTMFEYSLLIRCVEAAFPQQSPRQTLSMLRQFYFGSQAWSDRRDWYWRYVIPCALNVENPRLRLHAKLVHALLDAKTMIADGDQSHVLAALDALQCPSPHLFVTELGASARLVSMPNYVAATWGGDIGSAAALKAYDEARGRPDGWSTYFGPNGNRASYLDLRGDLNGFVLGYAISGQQCAATPRPASWTRPLSELYAAYASEIPSALSNYRENCLECFASMVRARTPDGRLDEARFLRLWRFEVSDFARPYFFKQDYDARVWRNPVRRMVQDRCDTVVAMFADFVNNSRW